MPATRKASAKSVPRPANPDVTLFVGIDPGKSGGISFVYPGGRIKAYHTPVIKHRKVYPRAKTKSGKPKVSTKTEYNVKAMFLLMYMAKQWLQKKPGRRVVVCIEKQWARPHDSKHVVMVISESFTTWRVMSKLLALYTVEVSPGAWKCRYVKMGAKKDASIKACQRLYPQLNLPLKKDECLAEATLIADYVARRESGKEYPRKPPKRTKRKKGVRNKLSPAAKTKSTSSVMRQFMVSINVNRKDGTNGKAIQAASPVGGNVKLVLRQNDAKAKGEVKRLVRTG